MKPKMKIKLGIDLLMTVLLLCLMAYQITGEMLHEWLGAGMLFLFLAHSVLNIRWYGKLFSGTYNALHILQTIVNLSVLISMLFLGYSGITLSRHVFAALPTGGPMAAARSMHMAAAYWGFVLMSIHLGMHWGMIVEIFRRLLKGRKLLTAAEWGLRLAAAAIAGYGLCCFIRKNLVSYMFLQNQFVFFDFQQGVISVFAEYVAMMGFWTFVSFHVIRGIGRLYDNHRKKGKQ